MLGPCFSNERISWHKGLHCNFAYLLYFKLINQITKEHSINVISSLVDVELDFVVMASLSNSLEWTWTLCATTSFLFLTTCYAPLAVQTLQNMQPVNWIKGGDKSTVKDIFFKKCVGEYFKSGVGVERAVLTFSTTPAFNLFPPCSHLLHFMLNVILSPRWNTPVWPPSPQQLVLQGLMEDNTKNGIPNAHSPKSFLGFISQVKSTKSYW